MPTSSHNPEVCLALDFHPKGGHMKLNDDRPLSTGNAPVSIKSKTYFFAGISSEPINTCDLNGVIIEAKRDSDNKDVKAVPVTVPISPTHKVEPKLTSRKPDIPVAPVVPMEDVYPKRSKLNLYTLVMNGVRVLLTKALAFSTILTVRAVVF
ncbi:uncharacterized protein trdc isoform X2 [Oryzias latipes]